MRTPTPTTMAELARAGGSVEGSVVLHTYRADGSMLAESLRRLAVRPATHPAAWEVRVLAPGSDFEDPETVLTGEAAAAAAAAAALFDALLAGAR